MKNLLILILCLSLSCAGYAQEKPKTPVQWQALTIGWNYQNEFSNKVTRAYYINWMVSGAFTYERWTGRVQYLLPTHKYAFKEPFYNLSLEYTLLKRK